jgi:hypothetical protein
LYIWANREDYRSISLIRLSRERSFHYLVDHAIIEQPLVFDSVLEAQCVIQSVNIGRMTIAPLNVPLADFATYPIDRYSETPKQS